jgi:aryl-alcohol dehydrogenase-like predicted oxidoreductase
VITGATSPEQVRENLKAEEVVARLDSDAMNRIADVISVVKETEDE